MKTVLIVFVITFVGMSVYSFRLSQRPQTECRGSSVRGFIDHGSDAEGAASPRAAAADFLPERTQRTVVARVPEDQGGGTVVRAYDGDELLAVIEVSGTPALGWRTTGTETC